MYSPWRIHPAYPLSPVNDCGGSETDAMLTCDTWAGSLDSSDAHASVTQDGDDPSDLAADDLDGDGATDLAWG